MRLKMTRSKMKTTFQVQPWKRFLWKKYKPHNQLGMFKKNIILLMTHSQQQCRIKICTNNTTTMIMGSSRTWNNISKIMMTTRITMPKEQMLTTTNNSMMDNNNRSSRFTTTRATNSSRSSNNTMMVNNSKQQLIQINKMSWFKEMVKNKLTKWKMSKRHLWKVCKVTSIRPQNK